MHLNTTRTIVQRNETCPPPFWDVAGCTIRIQYTPRAKVKT